MESISIEEIEDFGREVHRSNMYGRKLQSIERKLVRCKRCGVLFLRCVISFLMHFIILMLLMTSSTIISSLSRVVMKRWNTLKNIVTQEGFMSQMNV